MHCSSRDRRLRRGATALALAATITLSACDDGAEGADGAAAGATPAQGSPSASRSSSTSATPSAAPSPGASTSTGVAPAAGKLVETSYFTARVPKGYQVEVMGKDFSIAAGGPDGEVGFSIINLQGSDLTLAQLARDSRKYAFGLEHAPVGRTTTLGGEPAYFLMASKPGHVVSDVGLEHDGFLIHVQVDSWGTRAAHMRLLDSVLATWQWK